MKGHHRKATSRCFESPLSLIKYSEEKYTPQLSVPPARYNKDQRYEDV